MIEGSASEVWSLLVDTDRWPEWGPSIRSASCDTTVLHAGSRGIVVTVGGLKLPYVITDFEEGRSWSWRVAGVAATDHTVEPVGADRCRVTFGVPAFVPAYLIVCRLALHRIRSQVAPS